MFHNLNSRGAVSIDEKNVAGYMELYIAYVYERGNSFEFVHDPQKREEPELVGSEDCLYHISVPLVYQDSVVQSHIAVEQKGAIHVKKPTEVSFLVDLSPGEEITYRHPLEDKIISESKVLLKETEEGARLVQQAEEQGTQIRVLNSPNYQGFVTNDRLCYLLMPAAEQTAKYTQALILAGVFT